jgi:hypothetical protein
VKRRNVIVLSALVNIILLAGFLILYTNAARPLVGHDFRLYLPRLMDSQLFYKVNGLAIEWYTPSFGGGLPAYPNPNQMQFSLQQFFTLFVNPWTAVMLSIAVYALVGFGLMALLLNDVLGFSPFAAVLGAVFFIGNGFLIERAVVGHVNFISFPLIVIPIYAFLNRRLPVWICASLIALTGAVLVNSGGVYIGIIALFSLLLTLPLVTFIKPGLLDGRRLLKVAAFGLVLTLLLSGSKLYAINAFMHSFPRVKQDHYFVSWAESLGGLVMQLVGVMTTLPFLKLFGKSGLVFAVRLAAWTGSPYGFWEQDASLSPVLLTLLVFGAVGILVRKPKLEKSRLIGKISMALLLALAVVLVVQFSTARGFFFEHLRSLPVLESTRVNTRFTAAFILPLSILGGKVFSDISSRFNRRKSLVFFILMNAASLLCLGAYALLPMQVQLRSFDPRQIIETYQAVQSGHVFPVKRIVSNMNDYEVFIGQASNVSHHYDPLFGVSTFTPKVHNGSVYDVTDGYFNMTDPTGYVFPAENGSSLYSLIPVKDKARLVDFVNRRKVDWKLPLVQIILDWAAGLTFILVVLCLSGYLVIKAGGSNR